MKRISILFILAFLLESCTAPKSYIRTLPYVADVEGKADLEASGTAGAAHLELMSYYSPVDHLFIQGHVYAGVMGLKTDFGIGTYSSKGKFGFETLVGFGNGILYGERHIKEGSGLLGGNEEEHYRVRGNFTAPFLQQNLCFDLDENWTIGLVGRLNRVKYQRFSYVELRTDNPDPALPDEKEIGNWDPEGWVLDSGVFAKYNVNRLAFALHLGWTFDDFHGGQYRRSKWDLPYYDPWLTSLSIGYWIGNP